MPLPPPTLEPEAMGYVYLIHFDRPYKHARHYIGYSRDTVLREGRHRTGNGARLMRVVTEAGIGWRVVRVWQGDRTFERSLKKRRNSKSLCPVCRGEACGYCRSLEHNQDNCPSMVQGPIRVLSWSHVGRHRVDLRREKQRPSREQYQVVHYDGGVEISRSGYGTERQGRKAFEDKVEILTNRGDDVLCQ